ncbi:DUF3857 domain-containing protein [Chitinophaga polysaccharea]|uniref:DUF3857 domain-containing protein n=1 Tax=Chitinophaga TaxID=79328 RepID=UPI0014554FE1|nr:MULTISPECIES: DUF3857 domain-containing protein [Chitinophaga]NLR58541.1 DUF3857 domain-containing protein [Chitinophaga polysaccharea]NLU91069.1 DUF3857 domain-containing protein [Chitinophaga sp. Ak27]
MHNLLTTIAAVLLAVAARPAWAGDPEYPVKTIPAALKENAHIVKRLEETTIRINDLTDVRVNRHYVITVLDEAGANYAKLAVSYSKLSEILGISGSLYDAEGKQVKRLKQSDIKDLSAVDDGSLMTDERIKVHQFYYNVYPYTIEYEISERSYSTLSIPTWIPQSNSDCTVEQSTLKVTAPADFTLRFRSYLYNGEPVITTNRDTKTYAWEIKQIKALKPELNAVEFYRRTPAVFLGTTDFELDKYKGNSNSWKGLGTFFYQLNAGRDVLPDAAKAKVHELTDGLHSREEKIKTLYKFMQRNNRYISIQLGIGGWQTFDAASVATKGYGDCKALSNYMMALLKEAGIKSNCVFAKAGENAHTIREDFPSSQFNHAILCVPGEKDTTWLECTDPYLPAGYLGGFTDNRPVLLLDEKDSKLVRTPVYGMDCNQQIRHINATVDSSGNMMLSAIKVTSGLQQDDLRNAIHRLSREKQLEMLRKGLGLSSYDIVDYNYKELETATPAIEEMIKVKGNNYATVTGKRMFITPNIFARDGIKLELDTTRQSDIRLNMAYRDIDSVEIILPVGYKPESVPTPVSLSSKFGNYSASVLLKGNTVTYIRKMERQSGTFPAAEYPELVKFYGGIYRADRNRLVLVKE